MSIAPRALNSLHTPDHYPLNRRLPWLRGLYLTLSVIPFHLSRPVSVRTFVNVVLSAVKYSLLTLVATALVVLAMYGLPLLTIIQQ